MNDGKDVDFVALFGDSAMTPEEADELRAYYRRVAEECFARAEAREAK